MTQGKIIVGSKTFEVAYFDNATSDSLLDQMPFTVALEDYAGMEKIFYPKQALSKEGAPEGSAPTMGDIMYYAPWGDVAIFYKDFRYAAGLVPMGRISDIQGLMEALEREPTATFEN